MVITEYEIYNRAGERRHDYLVLQGGDCYYIVSQHRCYRLFSCLPANTLGSAQAAVVARGITLLSDHTLRLSSLIRRRIVKSIGYFKRLLSLMRAAFALAAEE